MPVPLFDVMRYPVEVGLIGRMLVGQQSVIGFICLPQACDALLDDHETKDLLNSNFNLLILDGAFPECALGLQYKLNAPFMYINTVGFYTGSTSLAGSPTPYSITPHFSIALTDDMSFIERVTNSAVHVLSNAMHSVRFRFHLSRLEGFSIESLPNGLKFLYPKWFNLKTKILILK